MARPNPSAAGEPDASLSAEAPIKPARKADAILDNLMEAAGWILRNSPR
jgi:hypothetical protein